MWREADLCISLIAHLKKEKESSNSYVTGTVLRLVHNQTHGLPQSLSPRKGLIWRPELSREKPQDFEVPQRITQSVSCLFSPLQTRNLV